MESNSYWCRDLLAYKMEKQWNVLLLFCSFLIDSSLVKWYTKEYRNDSWVAVFSPNKNFLGQKVGFQYIAIILKYVINKHIAEFQSADIYTFYAFFFKPQEIW